MLYHNIQVFLEVTLFQFRNVNEYYLLSIIHIIICIFIAWFNCCNSFIESHFLVPFFFWCEFLFAHTNKNCDTGSWFVFVYYFYKLYICSPYIIYCCMHDTSKETTSLLFIILQTYITWWATTAQNIKKVSYTALVFL